MTEPCAEDGLKDERDQLVRGPRLRGRSCAFEYCNNHVGQHLLVNAGARLVDHLVDQVPDPGHEVLVGITHGSRVSDPRVHL